MHQPTKDCVANRLLKKAALTVPVGFAPIIKHWWITPVSVAAFVQTNRQIMQQKKQVVNNIINFMLWLTLSYDIFIY